MGFNSGFKGLIINNCIFCPHSVFCIYLKTNSDLCHLQHKLIGFYNRDEKCLQRGTDWVFKWSGLRFVCKGLKSDIKDVHAFLPAPSQNCWKQELQRRMKPTFMLSLSLPEGLVRSSIVKSYAVSTCRSTWISPTWTKMRFGTTAVTEYQISYYHEDTLAWRHPFFQTTAWGW